MRYLVNQGARMKELREQCAYLYFGKRCLVSCDIPLNWQFPVHQGGARYEVISAKAIAWLSVVSGRMMVVFHIYSRAQQNGVVECGLQIL